MPVAPKRVACSLAVALATALTVAVTPATAKPAFDRASTPFLGVHVRSPEGGDFARMRQAGVSLVRTGFGYPAVRPQPLAPFDWSRFDNFVAGTAEQGIDLLPVVYGLPPWLPFVGGASILEEPLNSAWHDYLAALVGRYGHGGSFWTTHPDVPYRPVRYWQIWNEPNSFVNWPDPNPQQYGELLARSADTIHAVDPDSRVVSAGVVAQPIDDFTEDGAEFLQRMFASPRAAEAADVIALHPYTSSPRAMVKLIAQTRAVMDQAGLEEKPIWITEVGWGAAAPSPKTTRGLTPAVPGRSSESEAMQRQRLRGALEAAIAERRELGIGRAVWYQWQDGPDPACNWCDTAGLVREDGTAKPLLEDFSEIARSPRRPSTIAPRGTGSRDSRP